MSDFSKRVGKRIRVLRLQKGLSLDGLAEIASVNGKHLGKCERGQANATLEFIEKVATALDVEPKALFDNAHEKDRKSLANQLKRHIDDAEEQDLKLISRIITAVLK
ncbi:helix-turn-helix transcriptional regulator [uncultured Pseudodesulfovibrio sp.]|uniref:helix-turn-helix domain-containing protein n=1 Tax=uncultured Pseudodesulfovibrio sp. TaxID=2035858 RepID=UPI0029C68DE2|nr:helix-turn-helix transcriptional regulator [uncultured Pseudodesulfovibrio sp.]